MNTLLGEPSTPGFGRLLRHWRSVRRMSQLALATEAGISTRHLSFLETGRARPSREMAELLAGMLDVPLSDRNALLVGAGYAPVYGERPLTAPELEHVRRALEYTLRQQEPYPALVVSSAKFSGQFGSAQWPVGACHRIAGNFRWPRYRQPWSASPNRN